MPFGGNGAGVPHGLERIAESDDTNNRLATTNAASDAIPPQPSAFSAACRASDKPAMPMTLAKNVTG